VTAPLPIRELLRFMGRAAASTAQAARVVSTVADNIQGAPADAEAQRALRALSEANQDLELRAHQLEGQLQRLAADDAGDDRRIDSLGTRAKLLEDRVTQIWGRLEAQVNLLRVFSDRLDAFEAVLKTAATAASFRQLGDTELDQDAAAAAPWPAPALNPNPPRQQRED
jgi:chromosome segregation ATPase